MNRRGATGFHASVPHPPRPAPVGQPRTAMTPTRCLTLLLLACLLAACARNPVTGKRELAIDEDKEIAMGAAYDPQIVATMGLYEDPDLERFLEGLGQRMAAVSHRPDLDWHFRIVDSDVVNAFAVPGGYVYFTRGILAHFSNEAELAGVLGHEIGHVTARHTARQIQKQRLAQVGMVAGAIAVPTIAQNFEAVNQGMQLLFLKYGRDAESESDALGVEYSTELDFDAKQMAKFFQTIGRLQAQSGAEIPTFLSTHPDPANREQRVRRLAQEWQAKLPGEESTVNRDGYLALIDGIIYGEDPKQGFTENGKFYHPVLKFVFDVPNRWQLANSPQQVQMASPQGDAVVSFTLAQGGSPEAAAQQWAQQNQVQPSRGGATTVNGMPAYVVSGATQGGQTQQGQQPPLAYTATFVSYGGNVYNFTEITLASKLRANQAALGRPVGSFRALTDPTYLNREPERVRIESVPSTQTLRAFLTSRGTPSNRLQELAILNGFELDTTLKAGTKVKVVARS